MPAASPQILRSTFGDRQRELLLKAAFTEGGEALDYWNEWQKTGDIEKLDDLSYAALPLLFQNLERRGLQPPALHRLRGVYRFHWCKHQLLLKKLKEILEALDTAQIDVLLLKGAALLFLRGKEHALRAIGELDVLVRRSEVKEAVERLGTLGWKPNISPRAIGPGFMRATPMIALDDASGTRCNLYWAPLHRATWEGAEKPFWDHASATAMQGCRAMLPSPTEQLLHASLHGRRHGITPPFECLADALFVLRGASSAVDWHRLIDLAETYRGLGHLKSTLPYLHQEFSAPVPASVLRMLARRPLSRFEILAFDVATRCIAPHRLDRVLLLHWLSHCRSLPDKGRIYRMVQFPEFLRHTWKLRSWRQLPGHLIRSLGLRVGRAGDVAESQPSLRSRTLP